MCLYTYIYIYIFMNLYIYVYVYIYLYIRFGLVTTTIKDNDDAFDPPKRAAQGVARLSDGRSCTDRCRRSGSTAVTELGFLTPNSVVNNG